ncbi:MAG: BspA family leucine-rich repeat surface protein [Salinispira sp.]
MRIMSFKGTILFIFCSIFIVLMAGCPMPDAPPAMFAPALIAGDEQLTASWAELAAIWNEVSKKDGKNAITSYNLRYGESGSGIWIEINTGITTSHTITELTNGMNYAVQVRAVNAGGRGAWSASSTARPIAPPTVVPPAVPGTMDAPTLYAGTEQLVATWTAQEDNGGSPITGYELQYRIGGGAWTITSSGITGTYHSITGLTNGIVYGVQVRAVNAVGSGPWSPFAIGRPLLRTQTPAGTSRVVSLSDAVNVIIASENLSVYLITGTHGVDDSGDITVTTVTPPGTVTPPTVNASTGIITVTAGTTAGIYVVYGETESGDKLFAEYFSVTVSPHDGDGTGITANDGDGGNDELRAAVATGISNWGDTADFNYIITAAITDMSNVFTNRTTFNGDVSGWDVSSVTTMENMFWIAAAFNGDISGWDVSSVTNMTSMLNAASVFNGDVSFWDVSAVTNMLAMFNSAGAFNSDISDWDVSSVTNMQNMFKDASAFNQDIEDWGEHLTLDNSDPPKYTGTTTNMFLNSGVTGDLIPSWYE